MPLPGQKKMNKNHKTPKYRTSRHICNVTNGYDAQSVVCVRAINIQKLIQTCSYVTASRATKEADNKIVTSFVPCVRTAARDIAEVACSRYFRIDDRDVLARLLIGRAKTIRVR